MVFQKSAMSGVYAGLGAGVGSGVLGGLLSGTLIAGMVAPAGLLAGAVLGDRFTTGRRRMSDAERQYAEEVFHGTVDFDQVWITRDSMVSLGAPKGVRNTIHLKSTWGHFVDQTLELTEKGLIVLVHELGHIWQYQNGGLAYVHQALWAQYAGWRKTGSRNAAYRWREALASQIPWARWNPEQQATAIEEYNALLRRIQAGLATDSDQREFTTLTTIMENVWQRLGAPRFLSRGKRPEESFPTDARRKEIG